MDVATAPQHYLFYQEKCSFNITVTRAGIPACDSGHLPGLFLVAHEEIKRNGENTMMPKPRSGLGRVK